MEQIGAMAGEVLANIAVALLSLLAAYALYGIRQLTAKVRLQTQQLASEGQRKLLLDALDDVQELTTKTVEAIEQTTAKALREAVKMGQASPEELQALGKQALQEIVAALKPDTIKAIQDNFGSLEDYVTKCIETKVLELKSGVLEISTSVAG